MNGSEVSDQSSLLSISNKSRKKEEEVPELRLSFQKPLRVLTGNSIPDRRLHRGTFCWTKLSDKCFINSVTELDFKQEEPLMSPLLTCRNHFLWLSHLTHKRTDRRSDPWPSRLIVMQFHLLTGKMRLEGVSKQSPQSFWFLIICAQKKKKRAVMSKHCNLHKLASDPSLPLSVQWLAQRKHTRGGDIYISDNWSR